MFVLEHKLKIGNLSFPAVKRVKIDSNREAISDVAEIELPKYRRLNPSDISEGDIVLFEAGYTRYGLFTEFEGIVRYVTPKQPLTIEVEDYFYFLKKDIVSKTFRNMYAGDIVKQICADTPIDTLYVNKGVMVKYRVYRGKSKRFIIQDLAKRCGYDAFMNGKYLIFDVPFVDADRYPTPIFKYGLNVIEEEIKYAIDSDYDRVVVVSESTDGKGKIFRASRGNGSKVKTFYFDDLSRDETIKRAKELFEDLTYKGFAGDFTTFGYPQTRHSRKLKFDDERFPDKLGYYRIDRVEKEYGEGYRQKIYLGKKVA